VTAGTAAASQGDSLTEPVRARRWGPAHYLAVLAVPLIAYEVWTLISWLASEPHAVTKGREAFTFSWWWARGIEVGAVAIAAALLVQGIRESRRQRMVTFELKLWIALLLTSFWDSFTNIIQPIWFYSSNFINLNEWWGNAPGFVSPAGGHEPFPIVALVFLYPCFVLESRIAVKAWNGLGNRYPAMSTARVLAACTAMALAVGAGISMIFVIPHLWAGPGMGPMLLSTNSYRWSFAEFLYVGIWSATICALRIFTDEHGDTLAERGLDHMSAGKKAVVSTLAMTAWCSLAVIIYSSLVTATGFYARPYPAGYPEHLPNVVCDIPGNPHTIGSSYGPCPGSPGFKIPLKQN
jgi:hypothetical protein